LTVVVFEFREGGCTEAEALSVIDVLDKRAEVAPLNDMDKASLKQANESLAKLRREEESK
jgi:hypothetical protein